MSSDTHQLVDHLFRQQAGQMVAWLTRVFGAAHLQLVEEVVQDALLKALQQWPHTGPPSNPAGWLFTVARNGALDVLRRHAAFAQRAGEIAAELHGRVPTSDQAPEAIADDELRMVFLCCQPALPPDARAALSLKTVGGLSTAEIARAFLTTEATVAQRLVRAKRLLREQGATFALPPRSDLAARLDSVLEVIYLLFNEGYAAHAGDALVRQDLCREALRLARLVANSKDVGRPAAHALVALIALHAARIPARTTPSGELVLLEEQDRRLWDADLLTLGFTHLDKASHGNEVTVYHLQAAIAAVHAAAPSAEETSWRRMLELYDDLLQLNPSPIVALNRTVVLGKVEGADAALQAVAELEEEPGLANYYLLPSVKGALLMEKGDAAAAAAAFEQALKCRCSEPERRFLLRRLSDVTLSADPEGNRVL